MPEVEVKHMQAVVVQEDRALGGAAIDRPEPGPGPVRVQVVAFGVCGSELDTRRSPALPVGPGMGH